jgi:hypothetical protein
MNLLYPENPLLENREEQELGSDIERDLNEVCKIYNIIDVKLIFLSSDF